MTKEIKCPECSKHGRSGTMELLNTKEMQKLKKRNMLDLLPLEVYGCDECRYWCDKDFVDEL